MPPGERDKVLAKAATRSAGTTVGRSFLNLTSAGSCKAGSLGCKGGTSNVTLTPSQ